MNSRTITRIIAALAALSAAYLIGYVGFWQWGVCRIYVPAGKSLMLRYKGPFPFGNATKAPEGTLAQIDQWGRPLQVGILEAMPGPGRHFYSPLEYEWSLVDDTVIKPGAIGVVTSKVGKAIASEPGRSHPSGAVLVDRPGLRGTWRRVLTPGRYRFNPYAYDVKVVPAESCVGSSFGLRRREGDPTLIPPGYVGVVTNLVEDPENHQVQGIQDEVLQPGIYFLNPFEKRVDIISVGFNETTMLAEAAGGATLSLGDRLGKTTGKDPDFVPGKGIEFPSNDGFTIHMDFSAIWGILPDQAPGVVRQFGALKDVDEKVIKPQIGSICRIHGSKRGAVDLLVGDMREEFQTDTAEELERVLESKKLTLLFGLTRHIYVPSQVREPIQKKFIADELKLTSDQEQLTAKAQADLTEAKAKVTLEERRTKAETTKKVAEAAAEGEKKAREIEAETEKLVAEIAARTALVRKQITVTMGAAEAKKKELSNEAEADRYRMYVEILGSPEAYNHYVFAEGLPKDLRLGIFYAGPGTFWTDLKGFEQVMLGKLAADGAEVKTQAKAR